MRSKHTQNIAVALKDQRAAQNELFNRLKTQRIRQRAAVAPKELARLRPEQLEELFRVKGMEPAEPGGKTSIRQPRFSARLGMLRLTGLIWRAIPVSIRAGVRASLIAVVLAMACMSLADSFISRLITSDRWTSTSDPSSWPSCERLEAWSNRCVYRVQHSLSWAFAAGLLGISVEALQASNPHLSHHSILPPGSALIVRRPPAAPFSMFWGPNQ